MTNKLIINCQDRSVVGVCKVKNFKHQVEALKQIAEGNYGKV